MKINWPIAVLVVSIITACTTFKLPEPRQDISMETFYQRDMIVTVNGETQEGTITVPKADKYEFHVEARGELSTFIMNTCHKEEKKESAWNVKKKVKSGLFGWGRKNIDVKNEVTFTYYPNKTVEDDGNCPMELRAIEKGQGRHSWAFIDFEGPKYELKGGVLCNGRYTDANGVFVCQSRKGLKQVIAFQEEVHPATNDCGFLGDKKRYEFALVRGPCLTTFIGKTSRKRFKLTTLGYESILIRE